MTSIIFNKDHIEYNLNVNESSDSHFFIPKLVEGRASTNLISVFDLLLILLFTTNIHAEQIDKYNTYQYDSIKSEGKPWYEWWYYKINIPDSNESYYFVYGVVNPWDLKGNVQSSRSYVGAGDFKQKKIYENVYDVSNFEASKNVVQIKINQNEATDKHFWGESTNKNNETISWDINIQKKWSYNPVSWALGKNITDIEWYPAQASATCSGIIHTSIKIIEFKNVPCYQDRNWGSSFPKWWTWIVSNSFKENSESVLAVGGGRPSYRHKNIPFEGVSIGLNHEGKEYFFRPTDLNITKAKIKMGQWEASGDNGKYAIEISAKAPYESFMDLKFITPQNQTFHDYETLNGNLNIKVYKKDFMKKIFLFELNSDYAGIEYGSSDLQSKELNEISQIL